MSDFKALDLEFSICNEELAVLLILSSLEFMEVTAKLLISETMKYLDRLEGFGLIERLSHEELFYSLYSLDENDSGPSYYILTPLGFRLCESIAQNRQAGVFPIRHPMGILYFKPTFLPRP